MNRRRSPLQIEELGTRILPSVAALPVPAAPPAAIHIASPAEQSVLHGQGHGDYTSYAPMPDVGAHYSLAGSADLGGMGRVTVTGSLHALGFVWQGHAGGELTLRNAHGSVTLQLQGPTQAGFSPLPQAFHYQIVGATGAYSHWTGQGTLHLDLSASSGGQHGTFGLSI